MIQYENGITVREYTTANTLSNTIVERVHQTIENMVIKFGLENMDLCKEDPLLGILSAALFGPIPTYHITTGSTPRCSFLYHYLVHRKNNSYFIGIGPIFDIESYVFLDLFLFLYVILNKGIITIR